MATKKTSNRNWKNWQENYASFILGAIIVVILGLLVANFITNRNRDIAKTGDQTEITAQDKKDAQAVSQNEYKVQENDSLSKIAEKTYGDKMMWNVIAQANDIKNPNLIYTDMTIKLPSKEDAMKTNEKMTQTSYKVLKGDTLFKIAEEVYGNGGRWKEIAQANNVGRLPNGNPLIFADSTLKIPR